MSILIQKKRKRKNETEKDDIIDQKNAKIRKLEKELKSVKKQNASLLAGDLPKKVKKKAAVDLLSATNKYTPVVIDQMLKPLKTEGVGKGPYRGPRCNNWGYDEYASSFKFRMDANNKAFNTARKLLHVPVVPIKTQDKKFWWMHIDPP